MEFSVYKEIYMDIDRILNMVTSIGEMMLINGAETSRVEETMTRICNSFHIFHTDIFVIPTSIIISANDYSRTITKVKRVHRRTVDLDKVSKVNNLSRQICNDDLSLDTIEERIKSINSNKKYSLSTQVFAFSIVAGFFTLFFRGDFKDFLVSLVIGGLLEIISVKLDGIDTNSFFTNILCGASTALIAVISVKMHIGSNVDKIIIGSLMPLVPGLAITNAIRDTIAGELVAGAAKLLEAFLIAVAIAMGTGTILSFAIKFWGNA